MRRRQDVVPVVLCLLAVSVAGVVAAQTRAPAKSPSTAAQTPAAAPAIRPWTASGGDIAIRWNRELAADLGIGIEAVGVGATSANDGSQILALQTGQTLQFQVENGYLRALTGGALAARGGYRLKLREGGSVDLGQLRLVPRKVAAGDAPQFDVVDAAGVAWFRVDRVMHELLDDGRLLTISTADLIIGEKFAQRIGQPFTAGWALAEVQLETPVQHRGSGGARPLAEEITWHGAPAPGGGIFENDLFMLDTSVQYMRCQGCTGENGNGEVVIAPSSTLKNNVNHGSIGATVPGDPLGTSTALWTAGIPWYSKFSGDFPPYNNDQHPYLIWNMYRLNADGSIEQIGRSGVKQAFLTTNGNCLDAGDHNGHVLGRGCTDTYSTGNNDSSNSLSPRSEILPATGIWGRCGSIFDTNCDGSPNSVPSDSYAQRMIVREPQIAPSLNAGASWLFESWYLARQDINIYNSMSTRVTVPQYTGSVWNIASNSEQLGSAIDRWYAIDLPANPKLSLSKRHIEELVVDGARAKVAVKVDRLSNGHWRYHYAVMNFEFAFGTLSGTNPNLRVSDNQGFDGFSVPLPAAHAAQTTHVFRDGDLDAGNNWQFTSAGGTARWSDAADAPNSMWWGGLYSFTLTTPRGPAYGEATLYADHAPTPQSYTVRTLVPRP